MASTIAHRTRAVLPLVVGALLLAGCTAAPDPDSSDDGANDAAAARFVACLEDQGQTAKILEGGQVGVLLPDAPGDDAGPGVSSAPSTADGAAGGMTAIMMDDDGAWQISDTAEGYPEDGGIRDAWAACEEEVPEFEQPEPDLSGAMSEAITLEDIIDLSLAFADCARENGYADFADPDENGMVELPFGITEDEFRSLMDACSEELDGFGLPISQESAESLDFDWMSVMSEYIDMQTGSGMVINGGSGK